MKRILILILVLFLACLGLFGQNGGNSFILKGKLVSSPPHSPLCGFFAWADIAEFEIIEFSDEAYQDSTIRVFFCCPGSYWDTVMTMGQIYTLRVVDASPTSSCWTVIHQEIYGIPKTSCLYWFSELLEPDEGGLKKQSNSKK